MNKIRFEPKAIIQIRKAVFDYQVINPDLSEAFKVELRDRLQILREKPLLWALRYKTIRIVLFKRFPYSIHYTVLGDITNVVEILHQRQYYEE